MVYGLEILMEIYKFKISTVYTVYIQYIQLKI